MLLRRVEIFLQTHQMAATKFGRLAAHDPRFVLDLRMGRIPRKATEERTLKWMADFAGSGCEKTQPHSDRVSFQPSSNRIAGYASNNTQPLEVKGFRYAA